MGAPLPLDESVRLAALRDLEVLDSPPERAFDDIVQLARLICDVPIALVTLVDDERQWFKARVGLPLEETPRDQSFCAHALTARDPLIVPDATADPRFVDNPLVVDDPRIRAYVGVPLYVNEKSAAVGTLCVLDRVPRKLSEAQLAALSALARRVEIELRLRKRAITTRNDRPGQPGSHTGPATAASTLSAGDVVGERYRIERLIGQGGMGRVYLAHDPQRGGRVALKVMGSMHVSTHEAVERFAREARSLLRVRSKHVAPLLDAGNLPDGAPYLVIEYLDGHDLSCEPSPMAADAVVALAIQACEGVSAVHEAGIVHRDLKPGNLFLARDGGATTLKVLDFGISKLASAEPAAAAGPDGALTHAAAVLGSPRYMSPEQLLSSRDVDAATDIWALGIVLYELLTASHPFHGTSVTEICASIFTTQARPLREHVPTVPPDLEAIVLRCLAREKRDRWPSVRALRDALVASAPGTPP